MQNVHLYHRFRFFIMVVFLFVIHCVEDTGINSYAKYKYWTFSGKLADSYTNAGLPGVTIRYFDSAGVTCTNTTDTNGGFFLENLPLGQRGFLFSVDTAGGRIGYTRRDLIITAGSTNPESMMVPINIYSIVKLYPLAGSVKGKVMHRYFSTAPASPAQGVVVKARYTGTDAQTCSPSVFSRTTDSTGAFLFTGLPVTENLRIEVNNAVIRNITYKSGVINQPTLDTGIIGIMEPVFMEPVDLKNSILTFVYSNIYDFINQKPGSMIPIDSPITLIANKKIKSITMLLRNSTSGTQFTPTKYTIINDTIRITPQVRLNYATTYYLYLTATAESGETKTVDYNDNGFIYFNTIPNKMMILSSNVVSIEGIGFLQVPVDIVPYFVLSVRPKPGTMTVDFSGSSTVKSYTWVNNDTVFADPITNFQPNGYYYTTINGTDSLDNKIYFYLSGNGQFRTEGELVCRESNMMDGNGAPLESVPVRDTFWARYSKPLDTNTGLFIWNNPYISKTLWGSGPNVNSKVWAHAETLFVLPDERISLQYGDRVGFNIQVRTAQGLKSSSRTFECSLEKLNFSLKTSNTVDSMGRMRENFGLMEPVIFTVNTPIKNIARVVSMGNTLPPGIMPSCFTIKQDTVIFTPQSIMKSAVIYGFALDVVLSNGIKAFAVCPLQWKAVEGARIVSLDNKMPTGTYRVFTLLNDSLRVTFSLPIDTSARSLLRFRANIRDAGNKFYRSTVTWDSTLTKATIHLVDTLRSADAFAEQGYTEFSPGTRAIPEVTFDCSTPDGIVTSGLGLLQGNIELHSEPGLCVIQSNILNNHSPLTEVLAGELPVTEFNPDSALTVTFNRVLDTTAIVLEAENNRVVIADEGGVYYPCALSFSPDSRTIKIYPRIKMQAGKKYFLRLTQIPAAGIKNALAISKHAGAYTGRAASNALLEKPFVIKNTNITGVKATLLPDSNTFLPAPAKRYGYSAGDSAGAVYSRIVGGENAGSNTKIILRFKEAAWNSFHDDSVGGYQIQAQKIDRSGKATAWYTAEATLPSASFSPIKDGISIVTFSMGSELFFPAFNTQDLDGDGVYYQNKMSIFNDSARILIKIRPFVGDLNYRTPVVGAWSNSISIVDNVAPCDGEFVCGYFCDSISYGGVTVNPTVNWKNTSSSLQIGGYVEILFPEDMDIRGKSPVVSIYYGSFSGAIPQYPITINTALSRWISARNYRCAINIPPGDYTHNADSTGSYFNVNVAGCRDIAGNAIQNYGTDGEKAKLNVDWKNADDQIQGSASVIRRFFLCQ